MSEFSHIVEAESIPGNGRIFKLSGNPAECEALAKRYDILTVKDLSATVRVHPVQPAGVLRVDGQIHAEVEQACSISLEPVPETVEETFSVEFGPVEEEVDIELTLEDDDPVEPLEDGKIDIGELVAQYLALALDPYPRAPGVEIEDALPKGKSAGIISLNQPSGPFAGLAALKNKGLENT